MTDMVCILSGKEYPINTRQLAEDLAEANCELVTISKHGELVIDDLTHSKHYPYRREVWQMCEEGQGTNNTEWAGQEFEFCRGIRLED